MKLNIINEDVIISSQTMDKIITKVMKHKLELGFYRAIEYAIRANFLPYTNDIAKQVQKEMSRRSAIHRAAIKRPKSLKQQYLF